MTNKYLTDEEDEELAEILSGVVDGAQKVAMARELQERRYQRKRTDI